jgi:adenylate cyclase
MVARQTVAMRVPRTFAFVDLSGFTRFTDLHGDDEAVAVLAQFRTAVRSIASDEGVRIAKWLGDGAMLVAVEGPSLVSAVVEVQERFALDGLLPVRAGLAWGRVILFEGDDYTGGAVNLASRLCDLAQPFEVLATAEVAHELPGAVAALPVGPKQIPGFGAPISVVRLTRIPGPDPQADEVAFRS